MNARYCAKGKSRASVPPGFWGRSCFDRAFSAPCPFKKSFASFSSEKEGVFRPEGGNEHAPPSERKKPPIHTGRLLEKESLCLRFLCSLRHSKSLLPPFLQKRRAFFDPREEMNALPRAKEKSRSILTGPAFGEGVSLNTLFLFPAPSKSLLPTFLQKSRGVILSRRRRRRGLRRRRRRGAERRARRGRRRW